MSALADDPTLAARSDTSSPRRGDAELVRGEQLGRYVVLGKLGQGGMGVVYAAHDPELDRNVALKLLHTDDRDGTAGRSRLLREAQALAKLAHPNIVAVHDVGQIDERVWLAMELVRGTTMRQWSAARPRSWQEVLAVLTAAGRGLVAAHTAGLVHRDFKPDNVMIGDAASDGSARVWVMDFGLACIERAVDVEQTGEREITESSELTRVGARVGTPAYMAAEQHAGLPSDARTDQFALCVTAWEAIHRERPFAGSSLLELSTNVLEGRLREPPAGARVPGWLRAVLLRGLSADPHARWPSVAALLDALARGQTRARARRVLAGTAALAVLAGGVALAHRLDVRARTIACADAGASIAEVWNDPARAHVREALLGTGIAYATTTADKAMPWLDAQADAWRTARTDACMAADVHGTLAPAARERSLWCLDERRLELDALVTELARGDATVVKNAVVAAAGLTSVAGCRDTALLERLPSPPHEATDELRAIRAELSRVDALASTGDYADGLALTRSTRTRAEALGWPPLIAAIGAREATLLDRQGEYAQAEAVAATTYFDAARFGAWDVAAATSSLLVGVVGERLARHADALEWGRHAEVALAYVGDPEHLREATRLRAVANVVFRTGDYARALALTEQAQALLEGALGAEHPQTAMGLNDIANLNQATGDHVRARAAYERVQAILEAALGPDHPELAIVLGNLAGTYHALGDLAEARRLYTRALAINEAALGARHPAVAITLLNLAALENQAGAHTEARSLNERALAIFEASLGPDHPHVAVALSNLANTHKVIGDHARARALYERALPIMEASLGPDHPDVATVLTNLVDTYAAAGDTTTALRLLERADRIYAAHAGIQTGELETRAALAQAQRDG